MSDNNAFFDAIDDLAGSSDFAPIPVDWYVFNVSAKEFKQAASGDYFAKLELTVTEDADGFDGRKLWVNAMLEGVDKNGRSKAFLVAKIVQHLRYRYGDEVALFFAQNLPGFDPETKLCKVPRNIMEEADLSGWTVWFDSLQQYVLEAKVKHVPHKEKDSSGKYVVVPGVMDADLDKFRTKDTDK